MADAGDLKSPGPERGHEGSTPSPGIRLRLLEQASAECWSGGVRIPPKLRQELIERDRNGAKADSTPSPGTQIQILP